MAENYYDKNVLQKVLISIADKIEDTLLADPALVPQQYKNIVKITPSISRGIDETTSKDILMRERQLLSGLPVPSEEAAVELYANRDEPIDFKYVMSHYVFVTVPNESYRPGGTYYFNIDEVNKQLEGRVFFKRINIKNASKDVYTLKANYIITLEIAFSFFGNLLEKSIQMRNLNDPSDIRDYAPIQLVYKYYDNLAVEKTSDEMAKRDADGLYIVQQLNLLDSEAFSNLRSSGLDQIYKNYHVTYYKHEFDVYKDENPVPNLLENSLVISYMAYESDLEIKIGTSPLTPRLSDNIYATLADARKILTTIKGDGATTADDLDVLTLSDAVAKINNLKTELNKYENRINCALLFKNTKDATVKSALNSYEPYSTTESLKLSREVISTIQKEINDIAFRIDRTLITYILARCKVYSLTLDGALLGAVQSSNVMEALGNNIGSILGGAALVTAGVVTGVASEGSATGIAVELGLAGGNLLAAGISKTADEWNKIDRQPISVDTLRNAVAAGPNIKLADSFFNKFKKIGEQLGFRTTGLYGAATNKMSSVVGHTGDSEWRQAILLEQIADALNKDDAAKGQWSSVNLLGNNTGDNADQKYIKEGLKAAMDNAYSIPIGESGEEQEIQFVLFGDLLSILFESSTNSYMVAGGKLILDSGAGGAGGSTSSYVNIMNTPISLEAVSKFLKQKILDTPRNLFYPSDLYIKDLYEILLKNALASTNGLKEYENFYHTNLRMLSTIHKDGAEFGRIKARGSTFTGIDTLSDASFKEICKDLRVSQNLLKTGAPGAGLQKIFTIGSEEEVKYYNFYETYNSSIGPTLDVNRFNTTGPATFQDWIIRKNWIPCISLNPTLLNDSILKLKNLKFNKIDNPNIVLGNIQGGLSLFRLPYSFSGTFKLYLSHFLDLGSLVFISPPDTSPYNIYRNGVANTAEIVRNTFGFGGLYVITSAELDYSFQRLLDGGNISLPNEEAKLSLSGYSLSWGDGIQKKKTAANKMIERCMTDAAIPAAGVGGAGVAGPAGDAGVAATGTAATTAPEFNREYAVALRLAFK